MITFINESLFSLNVEKRDGKNGAPDYYRTIIKSSEKTINKKNPGNAEQKVIEHVLHTSEDNFNEENTRINLKWVDGRPLVRLNQQNINKMDTPVFLIAIPYNGFIVPVERSQMYRIYKGFTVTLENPIVFEGNTYKHIAYITLVPNQKLLDPDGKNESCEFNLTSFSTVVDPVEGSNDITYRRVSTICFSVEDGKIAHSLYEDVKAVDPVNMDDYKGKRLFPLPKPKQKKNEPGKMERKNKKPPVINPNKKKVVQPNNPKNIKKPVLNKSDGTFGTPVVSKSLDEMIAESEKDMRDKRRRPDKNRRKKRR